MTTKPNEITFSTENFNQFVFGILFKFSLYQEDITDEDLINSTEYTKSKVSVIIEKIQQFNQHQDVQNLQKLKPQTLNEKSIQLGQDDQTTN